MTIADYNSLDEKNLCEMGYTYDEIKNIIDVAHEVGMHPVYLGRNFEYKNAANRETVLNWANRHKQGIRRLTG